MGKIRQRLRAIRATVPATELVGYSVEALRRASDELIESEARRYFVPKGTKLRIDLNLVVGLLLAGLARGIERRAARKAHKTDKG